MDIGLCLFKYFPYGGLQRDFLRIAQRLQARGHAVRVFAQQWQGPFPEGLPVTLLKCHALSNHGKASVFCRKVRKVLAEKPVDVLVGFNKMLGLDFYYQADVCIAEKLAGKCPLRRILPRYRTYLRFEEACFGTQSRTELLMLSSEQIRTFQKHYGTPDARFHLLPPGIDPDRRYDSQDPQVRSAYRRQMNLGAQDVLVLQIGSDFKRKGVDRSIAALAHLPEELRSRVRLCVIGQSDEAPMVRLAAELGVADRVEFLGARDDVPQLLSAADLLLHPAYSENTGTVLLEAVAAGVPAIVSGECGYAPYIADSRSGAVTPVPFAQERLDALVREAVESRSLREAWRSNAIAFSRTGDLYSLPEAVCDLIERRGAPAGQESQP